MDSRWLRGVPKADQQELKQQIKESRRVLEHLASLLEEELESSIKTSSSKDNFFMPAWSEYVASELGTQKTLRNILNLLKD
jgi:hypothetical protein